MLLVCNLWYILPYRYAIDRYTDPDGQFAIDGNGLVTTAKLLDREDKPGHRVHILAIDKGQLCLLITFWFCMYYIIFPEILWFLILKPVLFLSLFIFI